MCRVDDEGPPCIHVLRFFIFAAFATVCESQSWTSTIDITSDGYFNVFYTFFLLGQIFYLCVSVSILHGLVSAFLSLTLLIYFRSCP